MYKFNIITTYENGEQDIFDIELGEESVKDEKTFLFNLFSGERDLKSINKYSVCQICKSGEELLDFLDIRDGKFYFNDSDIDALDIKNRFLKNAFLQAN